MWLSEKAAAGAREAEPSAEIGIVTAGGAKPSVLLGGEKRRLEIASPGGFYWAPRQGEQVLVTRCGDEQFICGALRGGGTSGEVCVQSGSSWVRVFPDGRIELRGTVNIAGVLLVNGVNILNMRLPG